MAKCKICGSDVGKGSSEEIPRQVARALRGHGLCPEHQLECFRYFLGVGQGNNHFNDIELDLTLDHLEGCDLADCLDDEIMADHALEVC